MKTTFKNWLMALGAVAMLTACGGSGSASETPTTETPATETPADTPDTGTTNLAFGNIKNADLDTLYTTNTVTIVGITEAITVKTSKGTLVVNGVDRDVAEFSVNAGDTVAVKVRSSGSYSTEVSVKVTAGTLFDYFSVTTKADTVTPPVTPTNSAPTWTASSYNTGLTIEDGTDAVQNIKNLKSVSSDADGDAITYSIVSISVPAEQAEWNLSVAITSGVLVVQNLMTNDPATSGQVSVVVKATATGGSANTTITFNFNDVQ